MQEQMLVTFNDGTKYPQLGLGTWKARGDEAISAIKSAFDAGYRHIDTASAYGNEREVGEAIAQSGLQREQIKVTSKLWNDDQGFDSALRAFEETERKLGSAPDLYLIHWPVPSRNLYVDSWKALVRLQGEGRVKSIGVSNFHAEHIRRIIDETGVVPAVNQIELHPDYQQGETVSYLRETGIITESHSPLGRGQVEADDVLKAIAQKHDRSVVQIVLRWHLQQGFIVIPKSATPAHIASNFDVFDFDLDDDDMAEIATLDHEDGRLF